MISKLVSALQSINFEPTAEDIADILWLALQIQGHFATDMQTPEKSVQRGAEKPVLPQARSEYTAEPNFPLENLDSSIYPRSRHISITDETSQGAVPFRSPAASALPQALNIGRSLRPLMRRVPSRTKQILNEEATAQYIAEQGIWAPILDAASTRWLEVALVFDESRSMVLWRQTLLELRLLLEHHGAFRDVRTWGLMTNKYGNNVYLSADLHSTVYNRSQRDIRELLDPSGQRLILVVSDCVSSIWYNATMSEVLKTWGSSCPLLLVQVLSRRLWERTALGKAKDVYLRARLPGVPNKRLDHSPISYLIDEQDLTQQLLLPVVSLEPRSLRLWAQAITSVENAWTPGYMLRINDANHINESKQEEQIVEEPAALSPEQRIKRFRAISSPMSQKLVGLLASAPITLPVVRLVQKTMLPQSDQSHIAEVFLGGLLEQIPTLNITDNQDEVEFDFVPGVRDLLLDSMPISKTVQVLKEISDYVEGQIGQFPEFRALLAAPHAHHDIHITRGSRPFARIAVKVLSRLGGEYAVLAGQLEQTLQQEGEMALPNNVSDLAMSKQEESQIEEAVLSSELGRTDRQQQNSNMVQNEPNSKDKESQSIHDTTLKIVPLSTRLSPNDQLRTVRESRQLSRAEVAAQIGTSRVNIGRWERGDALPDLVAMEKLCDLFQVPPQELGFPIVIRRTPPARPEAIYDSAIPLTQAISLVGREQELAQLKQLLREEGGAVLTALNGLPGVGKTTLAVALANDEELREYFRDGVLWADLGPEPNIQGQLRRWGRLLGLSTGERGRLNSGEEWAIALRSAIGARKMLLIIDDAWNVEESLAFKVGGPNCAHLVTTRFPTTAMQMRAANPIAIRELDEEKSMELLRLLAPQAVERETKKARTLVQAVGGLPLALTLMGNYLRLRAYSGQPRRIQAALDLLNSAEARLQISESRAPGDRHPSLSPSASLSLQSIIAVIDQQLSKEARAALYALSVFPARPSSFSEEAALEIAACTTDTLDALIDAGLLEGSGTDRYMLHRTIADYAHLHLKDTTATERLIAYANAYIEAHKTDYELLDQENAVILAALEVAFQARKQAALIRGVSAFAPFLLLRGNYIQAERHVQRAYEAALALGDRHSITDALLFKGEIASKQGLYAQAESSFKEGLALAQQVGDSDRTSALLRDLGWMTWKQGNYVQANTYLQEGLAIARQGGHLERISALLNTLGSLAASQGKYRLSETYQREGLEIARQSGDREQICGLLLNLGVTVAEQGNDERAEAYMQEALALARQIGHLEWTISVLLNIGEMSDDQGNYTRAEGYYAEALPLARQTGLREWISIILTSMGKLAVKQGNYSRAGAYLLESLDLAQQIGSPRIICVCLYEHGNLYLKQQLLDSAEAAFAEMLAAIPEGDQELLAFAQYGLARVAAARGNIQEGRRLGEQSEKALEAIGHRGAQEIKKWLNSIASDA